MFKVTFYETADGRKPASEFLNGLEARARDQTTHELTILAQKGNLLREPKSKPIVDEENLFEPRIRERTNIHRMIYFFIEGNEIIITHGFTKKTTKTPKREIERAKRYRKDYLERH